MTVGLKKGQLTVAVLRERLKTPPDKKGIYLKDLLIEAVTKKLITKEEFDLTVPKKESVVKCYLYSMITNTEHRNKIEKYVLAASQLYTRGSYIANLIALRVFGNIETHEVYPRFQNMLTITKPLFDLLEENNSMFKQVFCPERWPIEKPRLKDKEKVKEKVKLRLTMIQEILDANQILMNNLRPDWLSVMKVTGWDNSINRMYSKYRANIQVSLMNHLPRLLTKYLGKVEMSDQTNRRLLSGLLEKPLRPLELHNDDYSHILSIRDMLGHNMNEYIPKDLEYSDALFDLAIGLKKLGVDQGTYFPVSDFGRKYCYIDLKIAKYLLGTKDTKDKTFTEIFNLTTEGLKAKKKQVRQKRRKDSKRINNRKKEKEAKNKKNKKKKKKKRKRNGSQGIGTFKKGSDIASFETDGVGMSMVVKTPIDIFKKPFQESTEPLIDPVFIGVDEGRAKLYAAAVSLKGTEKPIPITFTRRQYYYEMKHNIRMKWEQSRKVATKINQLLSLHSKNTDFAGYLETVNANLEDIKNEYLISKERALWRMRMYRLKTRSLDNAVQKLFDAAKGRSIVFGIGNAKFASSGRGELSMPTTTFARFIKKGVNRYVKRTNAKAMFYGIDEFRTTMCCSRGGEVTEAAMLGNGSRSRRLRFSAYCQQQNSKGLRDRDIQAAENMLWCTQGMYYGYDRPAYLKRP